MSDIVALVGNGTLPNRVARAVAHQFPTATFLIPEKSERRAVLRTRIKRNGLLRALGQVGFRALQTRRSKRAAPRIQEIWAQSGLREADPQTIRTKVVSDVNGNDTQDFLRKAKPKVVLVFAVNKISPETLATTDAPFVNLHPGITPKFRGVHTGYWALMAGEPQNFGATIHLIDDQLDTGPIIKHVRATPTDADSTSTYNTLLAVTALPVLLDVLDRFSKDEAVTATPAGPPSPIFREPTLWTYLRGALWNGIW